MSTPFSSTVVRTLWRPRDVEQLLSDERTRGVLISASKDPDAKVTFVVTPSAGKGPLAVKIPMTDQAAVSVNREGRLLVELRRLRLGAIETTIPRYVETQQIEGRHVLVATALPGAPMSVAYHQWPHTSRAGAVGRDFERALGWLSEFQEASTCGEGTFTWPTEITSSLAERWHGHPALEPALERVRPAAARLGQLNVVRTAVHGDFWFGNILVDRDRVSGVVDWEHGAVAGQPLADVVRFLLSYSLYLDRHTRPGHRVFGHPGLKRSGFGCGVTYGLLGRGWYPQLLRTQLTRHLRRLALPVTRWYDVALIGLAEVAVTAGDETFGVDHLELLGSLPLYPQPPGT